MAHFNKKTQWAVHAKQMNLASFEFSSRRMPISSSTQVRSGAPYTRAVSLQHFSRHFRLN